MAQPHEVLGVAANADEATINAAFRRAAKRFHPDLNNGDPSGARRLRRLIAARDFLTKRRWRPASGQAARYLLPSFRKNRITKRRGSYLRARLRVRFSAPSDAVSGRQAIIRGAMASLNNPGISVVETDDPGAPADAGLGGDQGHTRSARGGCLFACEQSGRSALAEWRQAAVKLASRRYQKGCEGSGGPGVQNIPEDRVGVVELPPSAINCSAAPCAVQRSKSRRGSRRCGRQPAASAACKALRFAGDKYREVSLAAASNCSAFLCARHAAIGLRLRCGERLRECSVCEPSRQVLRQNRYGGRSFRSGEFPEGAAMRGFALR